MVAYSANDIYSADFQKAYLFTNTIMKQKMYK